MGGLQEIIEEQSTRRKFGPPKVISVNSIVFQGERWRSSGKCVWCPFMKGKKRIRKKNKLEINNNKSKGFVFSELPRAESIQSFILYFTESKTPGLRCTVILSMKKKHASCKTSYCMVTQESSQLENLMLMEILFKY